MSALIAHTKMLRALGSALHSVAEEKMPREGKVAPDVVFPDEAAAVVLGGLAQACERAASQLEEQMKQEATLP